MFAYLFICIYVKMYVCIFIHLYICSDVCMHIYSFVYMLGCMYAYSFICICAKMYAHIFNHLYMHVVICVCLRSCACMYVLYVQYVQRWVPPRSGGEAERAVQRARSAHGPHAGGFGPDCRSTARVGPSGLFVQIAKQCFWACS